jgi:hypothetical protein
MLLMGFRCGTPAHDCEQDRAADPGEPVLPGHQKRLLLAAPQLRELRAQRRRGDAGVAVPDLVPADSASTSPLQESVGQFSNTTGAASQVTTCLKVLVRATLCTRSQVRPS